jgi:plasmid stabilization system protein ParE
MTPQQSIEYKPINLLLFDPENPRLPSTVDGNNELAVLEWMLADANIVELMLSIGEKGYFPGEALLVVPDNTDDSKLRVIEGNRRLAAVRLLQNPQAASIRKKTVEQASAEAKHKPSELPVIVFPKRDDILNYLGYRHFTGIKTWGALAKAKYLAQLLDTLSPAEPREQYKLLAKIIGSRADYVARTLVGLAVYNKIVDEGLFRNKSLDKDAIDFSILTTALSYQNISKFIGLRDSQNSELSNLNLRHLDELTSWLFEKNSENRTRLGESRNLSQLNSVLDHPVALEKFRDGETLTNAALYTEIPGEIFHRAIQEAKSRLEVARNYIHIVDNPTSSASDNLREIQQLARLLKTAVDDKLVDMQGI